MSTNRKRTGKTLALPTDHLRVIPSPVDAGRDWLPIEIIKERAAANGATADNSELVASVLASNKAWNEYSQALKKADIDRLGSPDLCTPATRRRRLDNISGVYSLARAGAWIAGDPKEGLQRWALKIAETILAKRLHKKTKGVVTLDLIPDLPRRCDLTDTAIDEARAFNLGERDWGRVKASLEDAADAVVHEALEDMGWHKIGGEDA